MTALVTTTAITTATAPAPRPSYSKIVFEHYGANGSSDYTLWGYQDVPKVWTVLGHISSPVYGPWLVEGTDTQFPTRVEARAFVLANPEICIPTPTVLAVQTEWDLKIARAAAAKAAKAAAAQAAAAAKAAALPAVAG